MSPDLITFGPAAITVGVVVGMLTGVPGRLAGWKKQQAEQVLWCDLIISDKVSVKP